MCIQLCIQYFVLRYFVSYLYILSIGVIFAFVLCFFFFLLLLLKRLISLSNGGERESFLLFVKKHGHLIYRHVSIHSRQQQSELLHHPFVFSSRFWTNGCLNECKLSALQVL